MLLLMDECHLYAVGRFDRSLDLADHPSTIFVRRAPGPTIRHQAVHVHVRQIEASGDVPRLKRESDAQGAQDSPTDHRLDGIVAEQREVPRSAAGRDPVPHRHQHAQGTPARQRVEVGRAGGFQLGSAGVGMG